jgi:hypothetical protein
VEEKHVKRVVRAVWLAVIGAAISDAVLNRRRHGEVLGFVPYDFRFPTLERARSRTWNPESARLLTPRSFGVGWTLNFGRLARIAHLR